MRLEKKGPGCRGFHTWGIEWRDATRCGTGEDPWMQLGSRAELRLFISSQAGRSRGGGEGEEEEEEKEKEKDEDICICICSGDGDLLFHKSCLLNPLILRVHRAKKDPRISELHRQA